MILKMNKFVSQWRKFESKGVIFFKILISKFLEFSGIYFDFSGIFTDLILLKKGQKGLNISCGTRAANVAHNRHVATRGGAMRAHADGCVVPMWREAVFGLAGNGPTG